MNQTVRMLGIVALLGAGGAIIGAGAVVRRQTQNGHSIKELLKAAYHKMQAASEPPLPLPERADAPLVLYDDKPGDGWQDWSWATHNLSDHSTMHSGTSAISLAPDAHKGVYFHHDGFSTDGYGFVQIAVRSSSPLILCSVDGGLKFSNPVPLASTGDKWVVKKIALSAFGLPRAGGQITGFAIQDATGKPQKIAYLDTVSLLPDPTLAPPPTTATVAVVVDMSAERHAISPYIYGMAFAPPDYISDLKLTVNRWGGNDRTRYNWQHGNASNAARDWGFRNRTAVGGTVPSGPSGAADMFVQQNTQAGARSMLTIPTIGWVAKDTDNGHDSQNVPNSGGAPVDRKIGSIAGYDPTANRERTSVKSVPRQKDAQEGEVAQDEWVRHLTRAWGPSGNRGVRFYAMDNEPDLWDGTHTDVHPAQMGYDDLLTTFYNYASAVKDADSSALVTGPVSWGWTGYQYSPLDRGSDNFRTHADRARHDDTPFLLWFLQIAKKRDQMSGQRILDVLDVHYYPQGQALYSGASDKGTQARRLRSTRSLWDATYKDESWIGEPVRLVPRLRDWINEGYPGTKIGITEWNFGADTDISGGLADIDALGIFARENVYLANFWAFPAKNSPGYLAFKLLRNPDGQSNGYGDTSCRAVSGSIDRVTAYAATSSATGELTVLLVNKMPKATVSVPLRLASGSDKNPKTTLFRFDAAHPNAITRETGPLVQNNAVTVSLPPYSATLVQFGK